jgi:hypothetical protein
LCRKTFKGDNVHEFSPYFRPVSFGLLAQEGDVIELEAEGLRTFRRHFAEAAGRDIEFNELDVATKLTTRAFNSQPRHEVCQIMSDIVELPAVRDDKLGTKGHQGIRQL